jgi:serpin B
MAMSMLAEITDGASRQQILDLLDIDDLNTLRTQTNAIWNANYSDDGAITSILANSLWMNEDCSLPQDTLKTLGNYYYASVYQGKMGSTDFDALYRNWLNQQTRNHLEDYIQNKSLDPAAVMSLVSTIFYQAKWEVPFPKENTKEGIFHGSRKDYTCEYMYDFYIGCDYYKNDLFSAVSIPMESGGHMWIFLPKEGVSAETLLEQSDIVKRLASESYFPTTYSKVHLTLPKFSISSQLNLKESLKLLGLTEIFDTSQNLYVSNVEHTAKVAIDEEGCIATAYTEMQLMGAGMTEDEITFTADRPFMFAITSLVDAPLFVGTVNQPS